MTNSIFDTLSIIHFDIVMVVILMLAVFCGAKKRYPQVKQESVEVREKVDEVVWIVK